MSRTNLDAAALAKSLRAIAGDGDIEWVCEPVRAGELLDIADMLDENAELRENMEAMEGYDQMLRDERRRERELYVKAKAENEQLREQLAKARDPQRIRGTADPKSFVYAIEQLREFRWQHATNDEDAVPYINNVAEAHERETAKLRELVRDIWRFTGTACKKYPKLFDPPAQGGQMVQPNYLDAFEQRIRELGVSE